MYDSIDASQNMKVDNIKVRVLYDKCEPDMQVVGTLDGNTDDYHIDNAR